MICLAVINRYPSSLGFIKESGNQTKWSLENADGTENEIDLTTASPEALSNFKIGLAAGEVLYKLNSGISFLDNTAAQADQISDGYNSAVSNGNAQAMENTRGKVLTLNNGHSILGNDNNMGGFTDRLWISLFTGFGLGVITAAVYIFMNLSKFTFTF